MHCPFPECNAAWFISVQKNENADKPFGSIIDVYQANYRFIVHSMTPCPPADPSTFRVLIGADADRF